MKKIVAKTETIVGGKTFQPGETIASYDVAHGISFDSALGALANGTATVVVEESESDEPEESEFPGLPPAIVKLLAAVQITSNQQLQAYIAEGKDLNDLDGIGPATTKKILAWLQ